MSGQSIAVIIILALAAGYVAWRLWKAARGRGFCCGSETPETNGSNLGCGGGCACCHSNKNGTCSPK